MYFRDTTLVVSVDGQDTGLRMLAGGDVEGVAGVSLTLRYLAGQMGISGVTEVPIGALSYHLTTVKGREAALAWVEPALANLRASGEFDRLITAHLSSLPAHHDFWSEFGVYIGAFGGLLLLISTGSVFWNRSLHKLVGSHGGAGSGAARSGAGADGAAVERRAAAPHGGAPACRRHLPRG